MKKTKLISLVLAIATAVSLVSVPMASLGTVAAVAGTAPIIADLSTKFSPKNGLSLKSGEGTGAFIYSTAPDGTQALKLSYLAEDKYANYYTTIVLGASHKLTSAHKWVRVTYMTDDVVANQLNIRNNKNQEFVTLEANTGVSNGKFIRSAAADISSGGILDRLLSGTHCSVIYTSKSPDSQLYIKEIAFFTSREEAYTHYGDEVPELLEYSEMTFGANGNTGYWSGDPVKKGTYSLNDIEGTLDITYGETTAHGGVHYLAMPLFKKVSDYNSEHRYMRVLYSAEHPSSVTDANIILRDNKTSKTVTLASAIKNTGGEFVLSAPVRILDSQAERYAAKTHNSLYIDTKVPGGTYRIKAIYLFPSAEEAANFKLASNSHEMTINENDISKYRIVIDKDAPVAIVSAAKILSDKIKSVTGVEIKTVTDDKTEAEYEILVGNSNRAKSTAFVDNSNIASCWSRVDGNTLILNAASVVCVKDAVEMFGATFLSPAKGAKIAITDKSVFTEKVTRMSPVEMWKPFENVANPKQFTEDFSVDSGYFTEDNGADVWKYAGGTMNAKATDTAVSYIHVYEPDVKYSAKLMYTANGSDGNMGLMARMTSADAWIKAGYDFEAGVWYIEDRMGIDFYAQRLAAKEAKLAPNVWYNLTLTVDDGTAVLLVDGTEVLRTTALTQMTPGRVGVYAANVNASVDDVDLLLLSGEGTIWKDVQHTKMPGDEYIEGATVIEMKDGTAKLTHGGTIGNNGLNYNSSDNGKTWQEQDGLLGKYFYGYPNIIRLNNGDLMKIGVEDSNRGTVTSNGVEYIASQTSSDDGKTWLTGGNICTKYYNGNSSIPAITMNDKLFQSATTDRIFWVMSYSNSEKNSTMPETFCIVYYSDNNGKTWNRSIGTWEIPGNENVKSFSEAKVIQCADGAIRLYGSWNDYPCIVYSESTDNGKTWGPITQIPELVCGRNSLGIARDPYADNDTTYYLTWVNTANDGTGRYGAYRARLSVAKSTDGKSWTYLGDIWRWESPYTHDGNVPINHIVDPSIAVTKDYIYIGSGISEQSSYSGGDMQHIFHHAQRQHIWSVSKEAVEVGDPLYNFTDVTTKDDSYEAFKFCVDNGLFNGTSATTMGPKVNVSRAMFATVLGRLNGADMTKYTTPTFKDVIAGQWYTSFVEWAAANSVITGYPGGIYGIDDNITVEQACLILARYNGFKAGKDGKTMADFTDSANVSSWAADGVKWAVEAGVYEGSGTSLNPTAPANRAMMAEMMYNYTTIFGK